MTNLPFSPDGYCPPLDVEEHRFSDTLEHPLEITGGLRAVKQATYTYSTVLLELFL